MPVPGNGLTAQQEANRQRDGKFGAFGHSDRDLPSLALPQQVPAGTSFGGNFVPRGMTAQEVYPEAFPDLSGHRARAVHDAGIRETLIGDGSGEGRGIAPQDKALVDNDLAAIMADPQLRAEDKVKFQDMAEQLDRFGTVHMNLNGLTAVRFGKGSRYGGDKVPYKFASFYAKAETDARVRSERTSEALRPVIAATVQNVKNGAITQEKASVLQRLLGR